MFRGSCGGRYCHRLGTEELCCRGAQPDFKWKRDSHRTTIGNLKSKNIITPERMAPATQAEGNCRFPCLGSSAERRYARVRVDRAGVQDLASTNLERHWQHPSPVRILDQLFFGAICDRSRDLITIEGETKACQSRYVHPAFLAENLAIGVDRSRVIAPDLDWRI